MSELSTDAIYTSMMWASKGHKVTDEAYKSGRMELQALLDEIERLRADRDKWAELAKMYAASHRKLHGLEKAWDND